MANNNETPRKKSPLEDAMFAYLLASLIGAGIGTLIGFIIAVSLGETYTIQVETGPTAPDRVGEFHMPFNGDTEDQMRLTSMGGKWTGGGAGVGAAIGLFFMLLHRTFGAQQVQKSSSSSTSTVINAYASPTSSSGTKKYNQPVVFE